MNKQRIAEMLTEEMEAVAREHAAATGFDMQKEPHALLRMIAAVFCTPDLFAEARRRLSARSDFKELTKK